MAKWIVFILAVPTAFFLFSCSNPVGSSGPAGSAGTTTPLDNGVTVDPVQGIVAGFDFNQNITGDSPATLNGTPLPQWVSGISGDALEFTQDGQYVFMPDADSLDLSTKGSVEAWINPYVNLIGAGIVHKGVKTDFSDEAYTMQYWYAGQPSFGITNDAGTLINLVDNDGTTPIAVNQWHQIVATWDSTTATPNLSLYVDGVLKKSTAIPVGFSVRNSDGGLLIGQQIPLPDPGYGDYPFNGIIDNVNIFDRALSAAEIADLYAALAP
ncbi:MAG TPA: LamG domain-containing protein [Spirochaetia bacterium]|nr:LamG domain-containing protein [Spirochaetia bacterium]